MAYPQQQGPYGYQQPGGPPPKNNAGPIAVVIVVVAVLVGVGITGFVAPGFFLGDDKDSAGSRGAGGEGEGAGLPGPGSVPPIGEPDVGGGPDADGGPDVADGPDDPDSSGDTGDAQAFAEEFIAAVNAKDEAMAEGKICSDAPSNSLVSFVIGKDPQLEIAGVEDAGNHFVDFELGGTVEGDPVTIGGVVVRVSGGGSPCVFTFNAG